jgi:hypothetical protein
MSTETLIERGRWFPQMPPHLDGETSDAYTNRLTGADRTNRIPYDHDRNRQCSIGWHGECSDPRGVACQCPCHTAEGKLEARVWELEESVVVLWAIASGRLPEPGTKRPGWDKRILAGESETVAEITSRRPSLAEWYIRPAVPGEGQS